MTDKKEESMMDMEPDPNRLGIDVLTGQETSNEESKDDVKIEEHQNDTQQTQSGLEVMADAAAITGHQHGDPIPDTSLIIDLSGRNVQPISDSEINAVEFLEPDIIEMGLSTLLDNVYSYKNTREFVTNKNNTPTKNSLNVKYINGHKNGLLEMPLWHFTTWFKNLRFCNAVLQPKDGKSMVWHFRVIALDPSSPEIIKNAPIQGKLPKFCDFAAAFYTGLFEKSKAITEKIQRAVANDKTIMIVALRLSPGTKVDSTLSKYTKHLIVVSAVSYQTYPNPNDTSAIDVFVSLMGVAHDKTKCPSQLQAWRRNELGLFMFIQVIKRCASIPKIEKIAIYLQCQEASSYQFYTKVGFRKLNSHLEDGFEKLPSHMHLSLKSSRPEAPGFGSAFMFLDKNEASAPYLMHLRTGSLRHYVADESSSKEVPGKDAPKLDGRPRSPALLVPVSTTPSHDRWKIGVYLC